MGCIGWSHILGEKKNTKVNPARITYVLLGTGLYGLDGLVLMLDQL
jgi:hypothetical protein